MVNSQRGVLNFLDATTCVRYVTVAGNILPRGFIGPVNVKVRVQVIIIAMVNCRFV